MKKISSILFIAFCCYSANACSLIEIPLRKQFRQADNIFVGKIVNISDYSPSEKEFDLIPKYWQAINPPLDYSKIKVNVVKKLKGNLNSDKELISVSNWICGCGDLIKFEEGKEYLIFSHNDFIEICDIGETTNEFTRKKIKHFNSFWFRAWAKIYPF